MATETVGAALRRNREERGLSLADIARETRIPQRHLLALEADQHDKLPSVPYAIGFVRNYAKAIGLNADPLVVQLKDELSVTTPAPAIGPELASEARQPGAFLVIGGVLALLAVLGVGYWLMQAPAPMPGNSAPTPDIVADTAPPSAATDPVAPVLSDTAAPPLAGPPPEQAAVPPAGIAVATPAPGSPTTPAPLAAPPPVPPAPTTTVPGIVIRATEDSWVRVSDGGPRALLSRVLAAGETYTVPDLPGVRLTTGNAGGVQILVDGRALPPLGEKGMVARNVRLDRASLTQPQAAP
jgi:cytoskeleton protein RodZ